MAQDIREKSWSPNVTFYQYTSDCRLDCGRLLLRLSLCSNYLSLEMIYQWSFFASCCYEYSFMWNYTGILVNSVKPRLTRPLGGKEKGAVNRRARCIGVQYTTIYKSSFLSGERLQARYIGGPGKLGHGKSGFYCIVQKCWFTETVD